jgi:hypothetical protein
MQYRIVTISHTIAAAKPTPFHGCGSSRSRTSPTSSATTDSLYLRRQHRSPGRVGHYANEDSGLHSLSHHASVIAAGASLLGFVLLRLLLKTFKLTLIAGAMVALAYLAILRR